MVTFKDYCGERWGMSRRYAYNVVEAAETVSAIAHIAPEAEPPRNESQARELAPLRNEPVAPKAADPPRRWTRDEPVWAVCQSPT